MINISLSKVRESSILHNKFKVYSSKHRNQKKNHIHSDLFIAVHHTSNRKKRPYAFSSTLLGLKGCLVTCTNPITKGEHMREFAKLFRGCIYSTYVIVNEYICNFSVKF